MDVSIRLSITSRFACLRGLFRDAKIHMDGVIGTQLCNKMGRWVYVVLLADRSGSNKYALGCLTLSK